jgi:hypothetical protein
MTQSPTESLISECRKAEESCLYTSLSFLIWLRHLRIIRIALNAGAVICAALAGWKALANQYEMAMAVFALLAALLPQIQRVTGLDTTIAQIAGLAGEFKNLQDHFRRAANVTALSSFEKFETDAKSLFGRLDKARAPSVTPPEIYFWLAQRKIRKGDYEFDCVQQDSNGKAS